MSVDRVADLIFQGLEDFIVKVIDKRMSSWGPITLGKPDQAPWQSILDNIVPDERGITSP